MRYRTFAGGPARVFACTAIGAALTVTLGAAAPAAGAQARSAAVTDFKFALKAVAVVSTSDAWAVGDSATVLHWNGTTWAPVGIPGLPSDVTLDSVDAVSATDVWAVGQASSPGTAVQTLIVHWDGTAWARVPSPGPSSMTQQPTLFQVSMDSATDGWVVGDVFDDNAGVAAPLVLRWTGSSWRQVHVSPFFILTGVASIGHSDAIAVGSDTAAKGVVAQWAFHWNGRGWTGTVPLPRTVGPEQIVGARALSEDSATDMWAIGTNNTPRGAKNVAWHFDGTTWTQAAMPTPGRTASDATGMFGTATISPSDAWAVGDIQGQRFVHAVSAHWDGTGWVHVPTPAPSGTVQNVALNGVGADTSGDVWAVGYTTTHGATNTLILRWTGTSWVQS